MARGGCFDRPQFQATGPSVADRAFWYELGGRRSGCGPDAAPDIDAFQPLGNGPIVCRAREDPVEGALPLGQ